VTSIGRRRALCVAGSLATPVVKDLTGQPPRSFRGFARAHQAVWPTDRKIDDVTGLKLHQDVLDLIRELRGSYPAPSNRMPLAFVANGDGRYWQ
jgi:hypothetical protein